MKQVFEVPCIPGFAFTGRFISAPNINNGEDTPLYECAEPTDRPSINTLDGWSRMAREQNRREFVPRFGRLPINDAEVEQFVADHVRELLEKAGKAVAV